MTTIKRSEWHVVVIGALGVLLLTGSPAMAEDKTEEPPATEADRPEAAEGENADDSRKTALVSHMILKVINPSDARAEIERQVKGLGGFPVLVTDASLTLKVPPAQLNKVLVAAAESGVVIEKALERRDLTLELAQLDGQLKSKRKILERLRSFFDDSNVQATLRIEQTMTSLVTEIEHVKGRLRVLTEDAEWALVDISFQFKRRDRIVYVSSPFDWLNTVSLSRFLEDF